MIKHATEKDCSLKMQLMVPISMSSIRWTSDTGSWKKTSNATTSDNSDIVGKSILVRKTRVLN